ncbi:MAG: transglycosylase domain-containing protein [Oligoflexales bacterium]|nr:transglycosylase domain-containing protein [Oligoflexales bacterium]
MLAQRLTESLMRALLVLSALLFFFFWLIPPVFRLKTGGSITATHWEKKKGRVEVIVGPSESSWTSVRKASRHALFAIIVAEDARFYQHSGLDLEEIFNSIRLNWKRGRYARGASTITQQVVRLAFLEKQKTIFRKAREAMGAVLLDLILSKEAILEWYINLVDFGDGVYGLKAASRHYFSTQPELLTISQGVHLALVLPSPNIWSIGLRRARLTSFGHKRFATILTFLLQNGYITKNQWQQNMASGNFGSPIEI